MLVNLVTHLLRKMQVGDDRLKVGRTLGVQVQEIGGISGKKENVRKTQTSCHHWAKGVARHDENARNDPDQR